MDKYKLVPVEPTIEQIVAGRDGIESLIGPGPEDQYCSEALLAYRAMLAAAPDNDELTALRAENQRLVKRVANLENLVVALAESEREPDGT